MTRAGIMLPLLVAAAACSTRGDRSAADTTGAAAAAIDTTPTAAVPATPVAKADTMGGIGAAAVRTREDSMKRPKSNAQTSPTLDSTRGSARDSTSDTPKVRIKPPERRKDYPNIRVRRERGANDSTRAP
jgi:hypothetical protein